MWLCVGWFIPFRDDGSWWLSMLTLFMIGFIVVNSARWWFNMIDSDDIGESSGYLSLCHIFFCVNAECWPAQQTQEFPSTWNWRPSWRIWSKTVWWKCYPRSLHVHFCFCSPTPCLTMFHKSSVCQQFGFCSQSQASDILATFVKSTWSWATTIGNMHFFAAIDDPRFFNSHPITFRSIIHERKSCPSWVGHYDIQPRSIIFDLDLDSRNCRESPRSMVPTAVGGCLFGYLDDHPTKVPGHQPWGL